MNSSHQHIIAPLRPSYRFKDGCAEIGVSLATGWRLVKARKLHVVKIGGRTMIPGVEIARIINEGAPIVIDNVA